MNADKRRLKRIGLSVFIGVNRRLKMPFSDFFSRLLEDGFRGDRARCCFLMKVAHFGHCEISDVPVSPRLSGSILQSCKALRPEALRPPLQARSVRRVP